MRGGEGVRLGAVRRARTLGSLVGAFGGLQGVEIAWRREERRAIC